MKDLQQITVIGLGLLGGSITLAVKNRLAGVKVAGYTHREATRQKARKLKVAHHVFDDMGPAVADADLVILATPVCTFENIFCEISKTLRTGCIVTDVGSTKVLAHRWAAKYLPHTVRYTGSHPIAGSEKRGIEFATADLFEDSLCILTCKAGNDKSARILSKFWSSLGCNVQFLSPARHDKILASVSHLPHAVAASLINSNTSNTLKFAGKGFTDTTRVASGPANIWADILITNAENVTKSIDTIIAELTKLKQAVQSGQKKQIFNILEKARNKRADIIDEQSNKGK